MMPDKSKEIANWLRQQADERTKHARARRTSAEAMLSATKSELVYSLKLAEKMAGRRLNVSTSPTSVRAGAKIDERIALKLEEEATKLSSWADFLDFIS